MTLKLHLSDADYRELISNARRMRGSIGLIGTKEATFNRHHPATCRRDGSYRFRKLEHGRVSVTDQHVRLTLQIDRTETHVSPSQCIDDECIEASSFVFEEAEGNGREWN